MVQLDSPYMTSYKFPINSNRISVIVWLIYPLEHFSHISFDQLIWAKISASLQTWGGPGELGKSDSGWISAQQKKDTNRLPISHDFRHSIYDRVPVF